MKLMIIYADKPSPTYRLLKNAETTKPGDENYINGHGWQEIKVGGWMVDPNTGPVRRLDDGLGNYILLKPEDYIRVTDETYLKGEWSNFAAQGSAIMDWMCGETVIRRARETSAADPKERLIKRFLVGEPNCQIKSFDTLVQADKAAREEALKKPYTDIFITEQKRIAKYRATVTVSEN